MQTAIGSRLPLSESSALAATPEERARIWADAAKKFPDYNNYAKTAAPREIPVVILEPQ